MIIERLTPAEHAEWDSYVERRSDSTCYHLRAWKTAAEKAYGLSAPFLVARRTTGGPVSGVLPLFVVRGPWHAYVTSGLFGAYGRILADDAEIGCALLAAAGEVAKEEKASYLLLKALGAEPLAEGFVRQDTCVIASLSLPCSTELLWTGFRDKIRNSVRKAQRAGLEARWGIAQLSSYYDVLAENMHRKGTPIYGMAFMEELVGALGGRAEIVTLSANARPVSAALVIRYGRTVTVPFASSRASCFHLAPNNLLYWEIMKRACVEGAGVLDFGRSASGSGPLKFKLGWGAEVRTAPFYVKALRGKPPRFDATCSLVRLLVWLWRRLPRRWADALGPPVCARFLA